MHAAHDINDKSIISGKTVAEHLAKLDYPQDLIDEIYSRFDAEIAIKKIVYSLSLGKKDLDPKKLLEKINQASNAFPEIPDQETLDTIFKIIQDSVESKISKEDIILTYSKTGILNQLAALVFQKLSNRLSREEVAKIVQTSTENFRKIEMISQKAPQLLNATAKNILNQKDLVLDQINKFIE
jgi:Ca2+-binding EF-hand superfamily protein